MEVQKCLEYYFERDATKEEIMKYIDKNIEELKKISKIKDIKVEIKQNEYEAQKATVILIVKKRGIKKKVVNHPKAKKTKVKKQKVKNAQPIQPINFKARKLQKKVSEILNEKKKRQEEKKKSQLILKQEKSKMQKIEKYKQEKDKKEEIQAKPIIKIETEIPIKKYGAYKEGGKFVPYQEKKKGKVERWKNKLKRLNKNQ